MGQGLGKHTFPFRLCSEATGVHSSPKDQSKADLKKMLLMLDAFTLDVQMEFSVETAFVWDSKLRL